MESDNKMKELRRIAFKAGEILLEYRNNIDLKIKEKKDKFDLVSEADFAADRYIKKELTKLFPDDAILTEESGLVGNAESNRVWMIDPLDGTYNYLNGGESFAVHIGLAVNLEPILGIVYAPVRNNMYFAENRHQARTFWLQYIQRSLQGTVEELDHYCVLTEDCIQFFCA